MGITQQKLQEQSRKERIVLDVDCCCSIRSAAQQAVSRHNASLHDVLCQKFIMESLNGRVSITMTSTMGIFIIIMGCSESAELPYACRVGRPDNLTVDTTICTNESNAYASYC